MSLRAVGTYVARGFRRPAGIFGGHGGRAQDPKSGWAPDWDDENHPDGLPRGLEPPPVPRLADIDWDADIQENAELGIPTPGFPNRALGIEEQAEGCFQADMKELGKWVHRQGALLESLRATCAGRRRQLGQDVAQLGDEIHATKDDIAAQRDQLTEQDLKFPRARRPVKSGLAATTAGFGFLETIALQPVIGQVIALGNLNAWILAAFAVTVIGSSSWILGATLHRLFSYEGPARTRRLHLATAVVLGLAGVLALAAVVWLRMAVSQMHDIPGVDPRTAGLLYAAMQASVQLGAMVHGWWHHDPRVRQLASTEDHLDGLRYEQDQLGQEIEELDAELSSLDGLELTTWLRDHRAELAHDYAADVHDYRNRLGQELIRAGHHESASVLQLLPLPQFVPPVETDADEDGDWLQGFQLPL